MTRTQRHLRPNVFSTHDTKREKAQACLFFEALESRVLLSVAPINLGAAAPFAVIASASIVAVTPSLIQINGDVGLNPGSSEGIPPSQVNGTIFVDNPAIISAQADLLAAYNDAVSRSVGSVSLPGNLGGLTFTPGLYTNSTSVLISGSGPGNNVTLDALGDPNAVFLFKMGSTLTTGPGAQVILAGDAQAGNVFWQVGSSATLDTTTIFYGNIMASATITVDAGSVVTGRLLGGCNATGTVTVDASTVSVPTASASSGTLKVVGTGDFDNTGTTDVLLWNLITGDVVAWKVQNGIYVSQTTFGKADPVSWNCLGCGDFNGDGTADVLWQNKLTGIVGTWEINSFAYVNWHTIAGVDPASNWKSAGLGDLNGDGTTDILWQDKVTGAVGAWQVNSFAYVGWNAIAGADPAAWSLLGTGDVNGTGTADILWQNKSTGLVGGWEISSFAYVAWHTIGTAPTDSTFAGVGDFNADGTADILWHDNTTGTVGGWQMSSFANSGWNTIAGADPAVWAITGIGDFNNGGTDGILWLDLNTGLLGDWRVTSWTLSDAGWYTIGVL